MNCKQGDLAIVIGSCCDETKPNLGMIVSVDSYFPHMNAPAWNVTSKTRPFLVHNITGPRGNLESDMQCVCYDAWLKPIRPDEIKGEEDLYKTKPKETMADKIEAIRRREEALLGPDFRKGRVLWP